MSTSNETHSAVATVLGINDATVPNNTVLPISGSLPAIVPRVAFTPLEVNNTGDRITDDFDFARQHILDVLKKTQEAIDELMQVAIQSQHPRSFEVLNQLLTTQREAGQQLLKLEHDRQKATGTLSSPKGNTHIANAIFIGTTSELLDKLKGTVHTPDDDVVE
jgi:hypothetical protein